MRVLVIEDEPTIVGMLEEWFEAHGHAVLSAEDGERGAELALDEAVEVVVLDIMLPGIDGREVLRQVRLARPELPILMLTARDELESKVGALQAGADDYLTKPFALEELLARVEALGRRSNGARSPRLSFGDLTIELVSHLVWRGERQVSLSSREFALLEYFARHPHQALSRQQILSAIWDYSFDPGSNSVDVYVGYLRRKIDRPGEPSLIATVRGEGYRFEPPEEET